MRRAGGSTVLDVQDADEDGRLRFRAVPPPDLPPGPAVLRAAGARLQVPVQPRR